MIFAELAELIRREIGAEVGDRLLLAICQECAGESLYIPRRTGRPELSDTDTPQSIQARYGVSRSTAYNWVSSWK
jgi:hypothetical protein